MARRSEREGERETERERTRVCEREGRPMSWRGLRGFRPNGLPMASSRCPDMDDIEFIDSIKCLYREKQQVTSPCRGDRDNRLRSLIEGEKYSRLRALREAI